MITFYTGLADSFQEVELGLPTFSDDNIVNGEDLEVEMTSFLMSKESEEQSEPKMKPDASVSLIMHVFFSV